MLTQIVCVAILLAIYQLYCLGIQAVQEPVGVRLDTPVPLDMRQQRKSMAWVVGVFDDFPGLLFTPTDIDVLDGRELGPSDLLDCPHNPL
jgi:hypothetical protein